MRTFIVVLDLNSLRQEHFDAWLAQGITSPAIRAEADIWRVTADDSAAAEELVHAQLAELGSTDARLFSIKEEDARPHQ